ncbi:MAG: prolyl oligopeptidase family serine peptidase [Devosia sp.]
MQIGFLDGASGRTLNAWMTMPASSEPAPAVLFLHGCSGLGEFGSIFGIYRGWADIFHQAGYAVLMIDSAGSRGLGHTCRPGPERSTMYRERPSDAYAGLSYLQSLDGIDDGRIFLIGWSQGGGIALLTMNSESIGRPEPAPTHDFRAAAAFYPAACSSRLQTQPYTTVEPGTWRTVAPIIIFQGAKDNWTPPEPCLAFVAEASSRGEPVEIVLYPDAVHAFDAPDMPLRRREEVTTSRGEVPLVGANEDARSDAVQTLLSYFAKH